MKKKYSLLIAFGIALLLIGIDQLSKWLCNTNETFGRKQQDITASVHPISVTVMYIMNLPHAADQCHNFLFSRQIEESFRGREER